MNGGDRPMFDGYAWAVVGFAIGLVAGCLLEPLDRLRLIVAWTIVIAWVLSLIVDAALPDYDTPATLNALALTVAGFLFGPTLLRPRNGGEQ